MISTDCTRSDERGLWVEAVSKISCCTSLRSIEININTMVDCFQNVPFEDSIWRQLLEFLELAPPAVSRITIKLDSNLCDFDLRSQNMDWDRLDKILCRRKRLESVVFYLVIFRLAPIIRTGLGLRSQEVLAPAAFIRASLPQIQSLGILSVVSA